jgi:hypothetical protein
MEHNFLHGLKPIVWLPVRRCGISGLLKDSIFEEHGSKLGSWRIFTLVDSREGGGFPRAPERRRRRYSHPVAAEAEYARLE